VLDQQASAEKNHEQPLNLLKLRQASLLQHFAALCSDGKIMDVAL
jgi:hypothetical protein